MSCRDLSDEDEEDSGSEDDALASGDDRSGPSSRGGLEGTSPGGSSDDLTDELGRSVEMMSVGDRTRRLHGGYGYQRRPPPHPTVGPAIPGAHYVGFHHSPGGHTLDGSSPGGSSHGGTSFGAWPLCLWAAGLDAC